ncbi:MAG: hypothetical protein ACREDR_12840 [Blastocatellia bacterium]
MDEVIFEASRDVDTVWDRAAAVGNESVGEEADWAAARFEAIRTKPGIAKPRRKPDLKTVMECSSDENAVGSTTGITGQAIQTWS